MRIRTLTSHSSYLLTVSLRNHLVLRNPCTLRFPIYRLVTGRSCDRVESKQDFGVGCFALIHVHLGPPNSFLTGSWCPLCLQHSCLHSYSQRSFQSTNLNILLFSLKSQRFSQQPLQPHLVLHPVRARLSFRQATHGCHRAFVCTILLPLFPKLLFITQPNLHITPLEQLTSHTTPVP